MNRRTNVRYSDEAILEGIRLRSYRIIEHVYDECFPLIKYMVVRNLGEAEDATDVFQDTMVALYSQIREGNLVLTCSFRTYLYSVSKNIWLNKLRNRQMEAIVFRDVANTIELEEEMLINLYDLEIEKIRKYRQHFFTLGNDCQMILRLYVEKKSMREIAEIMGYKSERYAKLRKYMCKEELKKRIMNDPECQNFF